MLQSFHNYALFVKTTGIILLLSTSMLAFPIHAENKTENENSIQSIGAYKADFLLHWNKYRIRVKGSREVSILDTGEAILRQRASTFGAKIEQQSRFQITTDSCEFKPLSYHFEQSVFGKKRLYRIEFDHQKQNFIETTDGKNEQQSYQRTLYDELSYQEALRCELKNKKPLQVGDKFSYLVRTKGRNRLYEFEVNAFEKIKTKLGDVDSIKMSRLHDSKKNTERHTTLWFSPAHDFLLLRLEQKDDDDAYALNIEALQ